MSKQIVAFTIAVVILMVLFLWREKIDFNFRINDQKITNFFVCAFTLIGTIATLFYTVKQYKLSELVNRTAIKPELYPTDYVFLMEDDEEPLDFGEAKGLYLTHASSLKPGTKLSIKNIGVGIAKDIRVEWIYDVYQVEKLIKGVYHFTPDDKQSIIPFLNPSNEVSIALPSKYLSCCGPKLFKKFENKYFSNVEDLKLPFNKHTQKLVDKWKDEMFPKLRPRLKLKLSFQDSQGYAYVKEFNAQVSGIANMILLSFN